MPSLSLVHARILEATAAVAALSATAMGCSSGSPCSARARHAEQLICECAGDTFFLFQIDGHFQHEMLRDLVPHGPGAGSAGHGERLIERRRRAGDKDTRDCPTTY